LSVCAEVPSPGDASVQDRKRLKDGSIQGLLDIGSGDCDSTECRERLQSLWREVEVQAQDADALLNVPTETCAIISPDGTVLAMNDAGARTLRSQRENLIGASLRDLFPEELYRSRAAMIDEVTRTGRPIEFEDERAGMIFRNRLFPIRDKDGAVARIAVFAADVTEKRKTDEALHLSESRYRFLFEESPAMTLVIGADGTINDVNRTALEDLGYEREDVIGKDALSFVALEDRQQAAAELASNFRDDPVPSSTLRLVAKDGSEHAILFSSGAGLLYEGQEPTAVVITGTDITEREQTQVALRSSEERYRTLFEESADVIYITSRDGRIVDISPSAQSIFGLTRDELIGSDVEDLYVDPDDRVAFQFAIEETGTVKDFETRFVARGGGEVDCLLTSSVKRGFNGEVVGYQGVIRDITERKHTERTRERERAAFRVVAEAAIHASDITDLCQRALSGLLETLGFDFGSLRLFEEASQKLVPVAVHVLGQDDLERVLPVQIDDSENVAAYVGRTREPLFAPDVSVHSISRSHSKRLAEMRVGGIVTWPVEGTRGNLLGVLLLAATEPRELQEQDRQFFDTIAEMLSAVLERKRAQEETAEMQEQLLQAQKMEAIGTLASGVAHDFNNLLTAIQGFADLAMMKVDESERLHGDLKKIRSAADRGAALIRQLMLFSRRQPIQKVPLSLNKTSRGMLKILAPLIGEDVAMNMDLREELWSTNADEGSLQQVLMNLAVNARDAMPEGGSLTIRTRNIVFNEERAADRPEARPGEFVCLSVEDTGVGMTAETIQRIFEPFFSTKGPAKGTGLGLSVVYGIVKQHHGWVDIASALGAGSTFDIYLPATTAEPGVKVRPAAPEMQSDGRGERILVVEDEATVRELAAKILRQSGYEVMEAGSVAEAVSLFEQREGRVDLVFSDVILPDRTGIELAETLRERMPELPILLSSGHADDRSRFGDIEARGLAFLQKPYSLPDLLRTIREIVPKE
jgi:PAS domain S-box-containing protein